MSGETGQAFQLFLIVVQLARQIVDQRREDLQESRIGNGGFRVGQTQMERAVKDETQEKGSGFDFGNLPVVRVSAVNKRLFSAAFVLDLFIIQFGQMLQFLQCGIGVGMNVGMQFRADFIQHDRG